MTIATPLGVNEGNGWTRMGRLPGPVMRSYSFMRVERVRGGWRLWDVLKVPMGRHPYETSIHKTLGAAKAHAMRIVAGDQADDAGPEVCPLHEGDVR